MKKLLNYAAVMMAGAFLMTSCGEDDITEDSPRPTLTVSELTEGIDNGQITVSPGSSLTFRWNAVQAGGGSDLEQFTVTQTGVNVTVPLPTTATGRTLPLESFPSAIRTQYIDTLVISAGSNLGVTTYTFRVTDRDGLSAEVEVRVEVAQAGTPMTDEKTGQFFHIGGSLQGSYDLVAGANVASTPANEGVRDMSNTDQAGNPFTGSFEALNDTRFVLATGFDYDNATVEAAEAAYNSNTPAADVNGPAVGQIYVAKLRGTMSSGNSYAVIKVTDVDPNNNDCNCGNRGKLVFDYKK